MGGRIFRFCSVPLLPLFLLLDVTLARNSHLLTVSVGGLTDTIVGHLNLLCLMPIPDARTVHSILPSTPRHVAPRCDTVRRVAPRCATVRHGAPRCATVRHVAQIKMK